MTSPCRLHGVLHACTCCDVRGMHIHDLAMVAHVGIQDGYNVADRLEHLTDDADEYYATKTSYTRQRYMDQVESW